MSAEKCVVVGDMLDKDIKSANVEAKNVRSFQMSNIQVPKQLKFCSKLVRQVIFIILRLTQIPKSFARLSKIIF